MFDPSLILFAILTSIFALRKATVVVTALQDNAGSFVNVTAERLHIRELDLQPVSVSTAGVLGDAVTTSIDEVPVQQASVNDSRSHIMSISSAVEGGTGAIELSTKGKSKLFNRNDLVLDPDEALFVNTIDGGGTPAFRTNLNIWYED